MAINSYSVWLATAVQNVFAAGKFVAILIICIGGTWVFFTGEPATTDFGLGPFDVEKGVDYGGISVAFYSGLWAYDGW